MRNAHNFYHLTALPRGNDADPGSYPEPVGRTSRRYPKPTLRMWLISVP
jgi:hypothetical protein